MNKILLFIAMILIPSCKKEKYSTPNLEERKSNSSGVVTAMLNGKRWGSTLSTATYDLNNSSFSLSAEHYQNEYDHEIISISNIYHGLVYNRIYTTEERAILGSPLKDSTVAYFGLISADAVLAHYTLFNDSLHSNYIIIDEYNVSTKHVTGHFQLNYYLPEQYTKINFGDTLRFTHGSFDVYLGR